MDTATISVLFRCKFCTVYYDKIEDFIGHRKNHFQEYQKTTCIILEETSCNYLNEHDGFRPAVVSIDGDEEVVVDPLAVSDSSAVVEIDTDLLPSNFNLTSTTALLSDVEAQTSQTDGAPNFLELITDNYSDPAVCNSNAFADVDVDAIVDEKFVFSIENSNNLSEVDTKLDLENFGSLGVKPTTTTTTTTSELPSYEKICNDIKVGPLASSTSNYKIQYLENPYVLLKRLTPTEIINASSSSPPLLNPIQNFKPENGNANELYISNFGGKHGTQNRKKGARYKRKNQDDRVGPESGHNNINVNQSKPKCKVCSKLLYRNSDLRRHMETHKASQERVKGYECNICGNSYFYRHHLTNHMKSHSIDAPFKCPQPNCPKAFRQKGNLKQHLISHSNYKPFKCPHPNCGKSFKICTTLKYHLGTHADEAAFSCPHPCCGRRFKSRNSMLQHCRKTIHTGELPTPSTYLVTDSE